MTWDLHFLHRKNVRPWAPLLLTIPLFPAMAAAKRACTMRKKETSRIDPEEKTASRIPRSIRYRKNPPHG